MQVLVADSLTKVLREPEPEERPLRNGAARVSAARNERESFQVVVVAGGQRLQEVTVAASELRQEDGDGIIPAS